MGTICCVLPHPHGMGEELVPTVVFRGSGRVRTHGGREAVEIFYPLAVVYISGSVPGAPVPTAVKHLGPPQPGNDRVFTSGSKRKEKTL